MKKIVIFLITTALMLLMFSVTASAVTMYTPDGRTANVMNADVEDWKAVGWYDYPVTVLYAPDGRTALFSSYVVYDQKQVGWSKVPFEWKKVPQMASELRQNILDNLYVPSSLVISGIYAGVYDGSYGDEFVVIIDYEAKNLLGVSIRSFAKIDSYGYIEYLEVGDFAVRNFLGRYRSYSSNDLF